MKLKDSIKQETINAMKNKDSSSLVLLRLISSFITNKEISLGIKGKEDLNDNEVMNILKSMIKSRENVISEYQKINDIDSINKEKEEIAFISKFLPTPYSQEETLNIIKQIINNTEATSIKDMGKIMKVLNLREDVNKFNKTLVAQIIKNELNKE